MLVLRGDISCKTALLPGWAFLSSFRTCVENSAERLPSGAVPPLQLQLAPDHVAGGSGIYLDSRKRRGKHDTVQRLGLLDYIFSRKIVAALLENLFEDHALHVAGEITGVLEIRARQVFGKKRLV